MKVSIAPSLNRDYVGKGIFITKVNLLAKHEQLQFFSSNLHVCMYVCMYVCIYTKLLKFWDILSVSLSLV